MRAGLLISLLLHGAILMVAIFGLPRLSRDLIVEVAVPVGIISEEDLARLDALQSEPASLVAPPRAEDAPPPPAPEPQVAALPPTPPAPAARPVPPPVAEPLPEPRAPMPPPIAQPAPEPVPLPPEPEPLDEPEAPPPEPVAEPEPPPEPVVEAEPPPEPEPEPEVAEAPAPEPPETQIAMATAPVVPLPPRRPTPPAREEPEPQSRFGSLLSALAGRELTVAPVVELSAGQKQEFAAAIRGCWSIDPNAQAARDTIVEIMIQVGAEGFVATATVADRSRYASDTIFRSAADRAVRAVRNPRCNRRAPPLPPGETIRLRFNPADFS